VLHTCDGKGNFIDSKLCKDGETGETGAALCAIGKENRNGKCAVCKPGKYRCTANNVLEKCDLLGEWREEEACTKEKVCSEQNESCGECIVGKFKCEDNGDLYQCGPSQSGFVPANKKCGSFEKCNAETGACYGCDPKKPIACEEVSSGVKSKKIIKCSADGTATPTDCDSKTPICVGDGKCIQCEDDKDCTGSTECRPVTCNTSTNTCVTGSASECRLSSGGKGICNSSGTCIECNADADCRDPAKICTQTTCRERPPIEIVGNSLLYTVTVHPLYSLKIEEGTWAGTFTTYINGTVNGRQCVIQGTTNGCGQSLPATKTAVMTLTFSQVGSFNPCAADPLTTGGTKYNLDFDNGGETRCEDYLVLTVTK
jgi:hypothetical protein